MQNNNLQVKIDFMENPKSEILNSKKSEALFRLTNPNSKNQKQR
jgi:hypothetical protein